MTLIVLIYVGLSLFFGGIAATIETWIPTHELPRAGRWRGREIERPSAIGMGLFVAVLWPLLLIGVWKHP